MANNSSRSGSIDYYQTIKKVREIRALDKGSYIFKGGISKWIR